LLILSELFEIVVELGQTVRQHAQRHLFTGCLVADTDRHEDDLPAIVGALLDPSDPVDKQRRFAQARRSNEQPEGMALIGEEGVEPVQFRIAPAKNCSVGFDKRLHQRPQIDRQRAENGLVDGPRSVANGNRLPRHIAGRDRISRLHRPPPARVMVFEEI
jgi:hypothetical protein